MAASTGVPHQDMVVTTQVGGLNAKNPIVEITIVHVKTNGIPVLTCVFGVAADSTLVSFPGSDEGCGPQYQAWALKRQPKPPLGRD